MPRRAALGSQLLRSGVSGWAAWFPFLTRGRVGSDARHAKRTAASLHWAATQITLWRGKRGFSLRQVERISDGESKAQGTDEELQTMR